MKNKKAQISSNINLLTFASIVFVVLVIIVTVGSIVATNLKENIGRDAIPVVNESDAANLLWGNNTNMTLDHTEVNVLSVYNCSVGDDFTTIHPINYTVFSDEGIIQCDTNNTLDDGANGTFPVDGDAVCVNYTYLDWNSAFNVSVQGEEGLLTFGDFFGVIAIIIVLVVIVGLLLGVIMLFRRRT